MVNSGKKYGILGLLILIFVIFYNSGYAQAQVLEDRACGYSFAYPFGWKAQVFPNSKNLIRGEINKNNNAGVQIRIYQNTGNFRGFVDKYVDDFMQQMQKHWGGQMTVSEEEFTRVAGYECFVISFDFTRRDNERWLFKQYLWPKGPDMLILQAGTLFELRALNEPAIDEIAGSLKFFN